MNTRRATLADQPELTRLLQTFDDYTRAHLPAEQARTRAYKDPAKALATIAAQFVTDPHNIIFVADAETHLTGYICGQIKDKPERVLDREGYIQHWFVEPANQHQGIGRQLLDTLIAEFKAAGCTHLGVDTHLDNTDAVNMYEHLGFTKRLITFFKLLP